MNDETFHSILERLRGHTVTDEQADQLIAAVNFLRGRAEIDPVQPPGDAWRSYAGEVVKGRLDTSPRPTIGRTVMYVSEKPILIGTYMYTILPAVITAADEKPTISLAIIHPPEGIIFRDAVLFDSSCGPGTWHWPPRV